MNRTKIEYLCYTNNPITGCTGVGCAVKKKCWARSMAKRLAGRYGYPSDNPFKPTFHRDKLEEPLTVKKPSRIGLCFMGDFFDKQVPSSWREEVFENVELAYWHTFLVLTKQPQNIVGLPDPPLKNFQLGVSVNKQCDVWRIEKLKRTNVVVKAVSFEPLLGHIKTDLEGIDWVIIGAQTRPNKQPELWWVDELFMEAWHKNIPIFMKPNLECREFYCDLEEFPEG